MYRLAVALILVSSPAFSQSSDALKDCPPIGQSAMNLKDTVIPKSGGTQTPETTPTTGENK